MNDDPQLTEPETNNHDDLHLHNSTLGVLSELLFILLPLLVLTIVLLYKGKTVGALLATPEWSFGAALLFGQTLVKFVSGAAQSRWVWERVALVVSMIIVLGLAPSLTVLALILSSEPAPIALVITQLALFVVGVGVFLWVASAGHYALFRAYRKPVLS
jgi:hypothetical protein